MKKPGNKGQVCAISDILCPPNQGITKKTLTSFFNIIIFYSSRLTICNFTSDNPWGINIFRESKVEKGSNLIINVEDFYIARKKPGGSPKDHLFNSDCIPGIFQSQSINYRYRD